jgi:hypothetical protein
VASAAAAALLGLVRLVVPVWNVAGLIAGGLTGLFFAYGPIGAVIEFWLLDRVEDSAAPAARLLPMLHPILSTLWVAAIILFVRSAAGMNPGRAGRLVAAANVATAFLFVTTLAGLLIDHVGRSSPAAMATAPNSTDSVSHVAVSKNPDIYYIILDGYARADMLARHYGFDNSEFLDQLRERGFQVSEASQSNYYLSVVSLASSLNFDFVQSSFGETLDPEDEDRRVLYEQIRDNAAARFLRSQGYRFVHLQSTWGATARNPYADQFVECGSGVFENELFRTIAEASWLRVLGSRASADLASCHLANLEYLAGASREPGPKFVFAHFLPPHHPYLFDSDGNILLDANIANQFQYQQKLWDRQDLYLGQLQFMNRRMIEVVDSLIAGSATMPIIILQSDHGPHLPRGSAREDRQAARFANLTAALLPGAPMGLLGHDAAPVNLFRHIFNFYFEGDFAILPLRRYYSPFRKPYRFLEIPPKEAGRPELELAR